MRKYKRNWIREIVFTFSTATLGMLFLLLPKISLAVAAPTILGPEEGYTVPPDTSLTVKGVVAEGSSIYFFVDEKLIGGVKAKNGTQGTASFSFTSKKTFTKGSHTLQAQATLGNEKSFFTEKRSFTIPSKWPRRIDGVIVDADKANVMPTEVMVENLSIVRPQAGLATASVVYESLAEGGIPRFLLVFARDDVPKYGPVRSARSYFVKWAKEYNGPYLHAGGSPDAVKEIKGLELPDVDYLARGSAKYFFRAGRVETVHNLFTKRSLVKQLRSTFHFDTKKAAFKAWLFKDDPALTKRPATKKKLTIDFRSGAQYVVSYSYDRKSNSFKRFNGGRPHTDANDPNRTQIRAKNVVVQLVPKERVLDAKKRIDLHIVGRGKGWLLQDGALTAITWKKSTATGRTRYYRANGKEVEFNRGSTWVTVVPNNRPVLWR